MNRLIKTFMMACIMLATTGQMCFAQLMSATQVPKELDARQKEMLDKIYNHPDMKEMWFVNIKSLVELGLKDKQIAFDFKEAGISQVTLEVKRAEFKVNGDYVWYGETTFGSENVTRVLLIKEGKHVFGTIGSDSRSFHLYGIEEGVTALMEMTPSKEKGTCQAVTAPRPKDKNPNDNTPETINPCSGLGIGVIIFFTPAAATITPDLQQFATTCVQQYNSAMSNSSSSFNVNMNLALKRAEVLNGFTETFNDIDRDLRLFNDNVTANNRLRAVDADLKVLITNGRYGSVLGIAFLDAEVFTNSAIVQQRSAFGFGGGHTFSHEVGHQMGADHNEDAASRGGNAPITTIPFAHAQITDVNFGFRWFGQIKKRLGTMMTSPFILDGTNVGSGRTWENVPFFSTPDRTLLTGTIGNANCCDNTRRIIERADDVRSITASQTQMTAQMIAPGYIDCYCNYYAEPIINCGVAPFTTRWEIWISAGPFTTEILSNDERFYFSTNPEDYPYGSTAEIRLQVTSSDGQVVNVSHFMPVWASNFAAQAPKGNTLSESKVEQTVLPNPVADRFTFNYSVTEPAKSQFLLFNNQGTLLINREVEHEKGACSQTFDVSNIPSGIYLLKATINKETVIKKITIMH